MYRYVSAKVKIRMFTRTEKLYITPSHIYSRLASYHCVYKHFHLKWYYDHFLSVSHRIP